MIKQSDFQPAPWLRGAHLQTLWAGAMRRAPNIALRRERLELPDGDFLDLDWTPRGIGPIVVVFHGLEGSSASPYVRILLKIIDQQGWRGVVFHYRGCSGEHNRLARSYHSGETGDVRFVIDAIRTRERETRLAGVGYSLGGNMLLKYLGEEGEAAPLLAAIAISVPYDLQQAAYRMRQGFSRIYQTQLVGALKRRTHDKFKTWPDSPIDLSILPKLITFHDFDGAVTAPLHGFTSADDYYTRSSSRQFLPQIRIPTLLLHARNDPFMTPAVVPTPDELSPSTVLELSDDGGHVGFMTGRWPWELRCWLDDRVPQFLQGHL